MTERRWFARWGRAYRPTSWPGVALTLAAAAVCVRAFVVVDGRSHSVSDTLYGVVPYWALCLAVLYGIAWLTSGRREGESRGG